MYKYYLGAFGNRSFLRPQFEILENNGLRIIGDDRWKEFPNGGTESLCFLSDKGIHSIIDRMVK